MAQKDIEAMFRQMAGGDEAKFNELMSMYDKAYQESPEREKGEKKYAKSEKKFFNDMQNVLEKGYKLRPTQTLGKTKNKDGTVTNHQPEGTVRDPKTAKVKYLDGKGPGNEDTKETTVEPDHSPEADKKRYLSASRILDSKPKEEKKNEAQIARENALKNKPKTEKKETKTETQVEPDTDKSLIDDSDKPKNDKERQAVVDKLNKMGGEASKNDAVSGLHNAQLDSGKAEQKPTMPTNAPVEDKDAGTKGYLAHTPEVKETKSDAPYLAALKNQEAAQKKYDDWNEEHKQRWSVENEVIPPVLVPEIGDIIQKSQGKYRLTPGALNALAKIKAGTDSGVWKDKYLTPLLEADNPEDLGTFEKLLLEKYNGVEESEEHKNLKDAKAKTKEEAALLNKKPADYSRQSSQEAFPGHPGTFFVSAWGGGARGGGAAGEAIHHNWVVKFDKTPSGDNIAKVYRASRKSALASDQKGKKIDKYSPNVDERDLIDAVWVGDRSGKDVLQSIANHAEADVGTPDADYRTISLTDKGSVLSYDQVQKLGKKLTGKPIEQIIKENPGLTEELLRDTLKQTGRFGILKNNGMVVYTNGVPKDMLVDLGDDNYIPGYNPQSDRRSMQEESQIARILKSGKTVDEMAANTKYDKSAIINLLRKFDYDVDTDGYVYSPRWSDAEGNIFEKYEPGKGMKSFKQDLGDRRFMTDLEQLRRDQMPGPEKYAGKKNWNPDTNTYTLPGGDYRFNWKTGRVENPNAILRSALKLHPEYRDALKKLHEAGSLTGEKDLVNKLVKEFKQEVYDRDTERKRTENTLNTLRGAYEQWHDYVDNDMWEHRPNNIDNLEKILTFNQLWKDLTGGSIIPKDLIDKILTKRGEGEDIDEYRAKRKALADSINVGAIASLLGGENAFRRSDSDETNRDMELTNEKE